ncbi:MAG: SDR family oxidoreductase, partial [Chitinophagales bacterium]
MKNEFPTIVITGATKGIGKATAELFATKGFNIAFCARNANDVAEVAEALQKINPAVTVISKTCDVSNKNEAMEFCNYVLEHCKRIDILV